MRAWSGRKLARESRDAVVIRTFAWRAYIYSREMWTPADSQGRTLSLDCIGPRAAGVGTCATRALKQTANDTGTGPDGKTLGTKKGYPHYSDLLA